MRPRSETRQALAALFERAPDPQPMTWRSMAQLAGVAFDDARQVAKDMARAGELVVKGTEPVPGVNRPMRLYARPAPAEGGDGSAALQQVVQGWAQFV